MESSLAPPGALVRPWRTATIATIVAVGVAVVEFALVVALALTLLSSGDGATAATPARHAAKKSRPAPVLPRERTSVLILNGNGVAGAAADKAEVVKSMHYRVAAVGNATRSDYGRSTVLYPPGREREAHRLAKDLGIQLVGPLDGIKRAKLHGATVALILGR
jgi:hypothetical protein